MASERKTPHYYEDIELSEEGLKILEQVMDPNSGVGKPVNVTGRSIQEVPAPLTMLDALRLAKERPGVKVRPRSWGVAGSVIYVVWYGQALQYYDRGKESTFAGLLTVSNEDDLFGPWEVVEANQPKGG